MRLGDICRKGKSSLRLKDLEHDGQYAVYGASGIVGMMDSFQNDEPYVSVIKDGAGVGRAFACEARTSVLGTMQALLPKEGVERDYLLHLVGSLKLGDGFTGSTIPHIYFKDYCKCQVFLPSLDVQRRIVRTLSLIEGQILKIDDELSKLDILIKSRFVEMFDSCEIQVRLGSVCRFQSGCTLPKEKEQASGEFLYAKVGDLNLSGNERIIVRSRTYVDAKTAQKCLVPKGSVVFPKRGGAIGTNKKRITGEACCLDLNLIAVIPSNAILVEYLLVWFDQMNLSDISNGSTVPQINNKDLDPLIIPLPFLELQQEFADFVARADKLRQAA